MKPVCDVDQITGPAPGEIGDVSFLRSRYNRAMCCLRSIIRFCIAFGIVIASEAFAGDQLRSVTINPDLSSIEKPGRGLFLVARRSMVDPHFGQSVVYLVEHDADGTLGLIVNRPGTVSLAEAIPGIENERAAAHRIYYGGPVGLSGIMILLREENPTAGMGHIIDDIYLSSDGDVLDRILERNKPAGEVRFYVGYSGWGAGQLDFELARGDWHVVAAGANTIFDAKAETIWDELIEQLDPPGIHVERPSSISRVAHISGKYQAPGMIRILHSF